MSDHLEVLIKSLDVPIVRNYELESQWSYQNYSLRILEALKFHCDESDVSEYMKHQISRMMHQGYVVINSTPFASPVRSIFDAMELVVKHDVRRGSAMRISKKIGFDVFHCHFGQSSSITVNWLNHARKSKLREENLTFESMYESLESSLYKSKKTGEWIVYSKIEGVVKFWCIWSHGPYNNELIDVIKSQL